MREVGDDIVSLMTSHNFQGLFELRRKLIMEEVRIAALEKAALTMSRVMELVALYSIFGRTLFVNEIFVPGVNALFA